MCQNLNMNKVLITGSNGYIGSNIAKAFHNISWEVYGVDRMTDNANARAYHSELLKADYGDYNLMSKYIETIQPTVVVHCAGTSLVGPSVKDPDEYYTNNVRGTINFLRALVNKCQTLPQFMFSSSASVYGNPGTESISEQSRFNPMSPYGSTKAMIERILQDYYVAYGLNSISFRYFNAAGAGTDLGQAPGATHIVARILESKLYNRKFTLYGNDYNTEDGTCIRDYIHVTDIADAYVKAVTGYSQPGARAFNLGTNMGISNMQIIRYVNEHIGEFEMDVGPRRAGDPDILIADSNLAMTTLGWQPRHSTLEKIVDDAWAWYKLQAQELVKNGI